MYEISKEIFGITRPYPWQQLIISNILDSFESSEILRFIAVMPTGSGKSLCWMLPAYIFKGITLAVFPLLSLISDQERRLKEKGIPFAVLKGGLSNSEKEEIWTKLENRKIRIILASPEILQNRWILLKLKKLGIGFIVIDETHTVTEWGKTFRPACADTGKVIKELNPLAVLAMTATAGEETRKEISKILFNGNNYITASAPPDRPEIRYGVIYTISINHSLEKLVRNEKRPLIVFTPSRASAEQSARLLRYRLKDKEIKFYHAGLSTEEKKNLEKWFYDSSNGILCATSAYGMGVDKKNIRTVVHTAPPGSVESYLQESGRAGRDGSEAHAWLIYRKDPRKIKKVMDSYALSETCRREFLFKQTGGESTDCSGCDICGSIKIPAEPYEKQIISEYLKKNNFRLSSENFIRLLAGKRNTEAVIYKLKYRKGFGVLGHWQEDDIEEAVSFLTENGIIKKGRLFSRGRLGINRKVLK